MRRAEGDTNAKPLSPASPSVTPDREYSPDLADGDERSGRESPASATHSARTMPLSDWPGRAGLRLRGFNRGVRRGGGATPRAGRPSVSRRPNDGSPPAYWK